MYFFIFASCELLRWWHTNISYWAKEEAGKRFDYPPIYGLLKANIKTMCLPNWWMNWIVYWMNLKGPYADHILIPLGSTGRSTFFDIKWKPIFFWLQIQNFSFKFFVVLEIQQKCEINWYTRKYFLMYFHISLIPRGAYILLPLESKQEATSGWNFTKCISEVKVNQLKVKNIHVKMGISTFKSIVEVEVVKFIHLVMSFHICHGHNNKRNAIRRLLLVKHRNTNWILAIEMLRAKQVNNIHMRNYVLRNLVLIQYMFPEIPEKFGSNILITTSSEKLTNC